MGPKLRDADVPAALRVRPTSTWSSTSARRGDGEDGNLHWEWTDDVDWEPKVQMTMSSETANKYFQGKENVAMAHRPPAHQDRAATSRRRSALIPITKPVYARYRETVEARVSASRRLITNG